MGTSVFQNLLIIETLLYTRVYARNYRSHTNEEETNLFLKSYILLGRGREVNLETGERVRIKEVLKNM